MQSAEVAPTPLAPPTPMGLENTHTQGPHTHPPMKACGPEPRGNAPGHGTFCTDTATPKLCSKEGPLAKMILGAPLPPTASSHGRREAGCSPPVKTLSGLPCVTEMGSWKAPQDLLPLPAPGSWHPVRLCYRARGLVSTAHQPRAGPAGKGPSGTSCHSAR